MCVCVCVCVCVCLRARTHARACACRGRERALVRFGADVVPLHARALEILRGSRLVYSVPGSLFRV